MNIQGMRNFVRIQVVIQSQSAVLICCDALRMQKAKWKNDYELVSKAKIRAFPVPTVFHSPHPTPETR
jgi:hypothetical protein